MGGEIALQQMSLDLRHHVEDRFDRPQTVLVAPGMQHRGSQRSVELLVLLLLVPVDGAPAALDFGRLFIDAAQVRVASESTDEVWSFGSDEGRAVDLHQLLELAEARRRSAREDIDSLGEAHSAPLRNELAVLHGCE